MDNGTVVQASARPVSQISLSGVFRIPAVRQVVSLVGVAAAVAVGFAVVLWSQSPEYAPLYGDLSTQEAAQVVDALKASEITYKLSADGTVLVPEASVRDARMQLASQGLPQSAAAGMGSMQEQSSFGVSQFMENARYQHALEMELARTISSLGAVSEARVHLALPKETAFIRDRKRASASVLLHLYRGRQLESDQAFAIVHLVASSVPNLIASDVTLIDQNGRLLSSRSDQPADAMAATQFKYSRQLEETYKRRIEDLLTPLLGAGRVRAEVVADVDYTYVEETSESFDPARSVVRSEQLNEDRTRAAGLAASGIPGALSNQPPVSTATEEQVAEAAAGTDVPRESAPAEPLNTSRSSVRNYEVDRTIRHTRPQSGAVRRLSVAVLVDDSPLSEDSDEAAVSEVDIARYTALVKEAVGFSEARGDTVVVLNEAFLAVEAAAEIEPPAFWEAPVFRDSIKQLLGALVVLAIAFGVVRPMLRGVVSGGQSLSGEFIPGGGSYTGAYGNAQLAGGGNVSLPNYDEKVAAAKNITGHDPARVAQVVKKWVSADD
ncbi:MAG: flagellar basal-body MS-ring/collar protein FliF [Gammaproteobacteria bacterium]|nr:flagellar basal-body MS-ring/collar protein FliF [Gammaproteobacteria bacterium]